MFSESQKIMKQKTHCAWMTPLDTTQYFDLWLIWVYSSHVGYHKICSWSLQFCYRCRGCLTSNDCKLKILSNTVSFGHWEFSPSSINLYFLIQNMSLNWTLSMSKKVSVPRTASSQGQLKHHMIMGPTDRNGIKNIHTQQFFLLHSHSVCEKWLLKTVNFSWVAHFFQESFVFTQPCYLV